MVCRVVRIGAARGGAGRARRGTASAARPSLGAVAGEVRIARLIEGDEVRLHQRVATAHVKLDVFAGLPGNSVLKRYEPCACTSVMPVKDTFSDCGLTTEGASLHGLVAAQFGFCWYSA